MKGLKALIIWMAIENASWGSWRIRDEFNSVGCKVAHHILAERKWEQARTRSPGLLEEVAVTDFFTTEGWMPAGLKTYYVPIGIDLKNRRMYSARRTTTLDEAFSVQVAWARHRDTRAAWAHSPS